MNFHIRIIVFVYGAILLFSSGMKKLFYLLLILALNLTTGCKKKKENYYPIPQVPVNIQFNIDNPAYFPIQVQGGYMYMDGGVKGLVLIHNYDDMIYALDRACPFNYQDSCSQINMENGALYLRCGHYDQSDKTKWISCCDSQFDLSGGVVQGPAIYPMKAYHVEMNGKLITISN
jgi:nitrite reductase/ring-hydroxylating ferredoxin subunit